MRLAIYKGKYICYNRGFGVLHEESRILLTDSNGEITSYMLNDLTKRMTNPRTTVSEFIDSLTCPKMTIYIDSRFLKLMSESEMIL